MERFRVLIIIIFCFLLGRSTYAQTTLGPGDFAIIGYKGDGKDAFAFVVLTNVDPLTNIKFTDAGWTNSAFDDGGDGDDDFFEYTLGGAESWSEGDIIIVDKDEDVTINGVKTTDAITGEDFNQLNRNGDQLFIYQEPSPGSYRFIAAYTSNNSSGGDANWDGSAGSEEPSALAKEGDANIVGGGGLVTGTTAMRTNNDGFDNGIYLSVNGTVGLVEELLPLINNRANWTLTDDNGTTIPQSGISFTILHRPISADNTLANVIEGIIETVPFGLFSFADVDAGNQLEEIEITTVPIEGVLFVDANDNNINDETDLVDLDRVSRSDLLANRLKYNNTNGNSSSFTFKVNDGTYDSEPANTITITVLPSTSVLSLNRTLGQFNNGSQVTWDLVFGEAITGTFIVSNFDITTNSSGVSGTSVDIAGISTSDNITYSIPVNTGTSDGTLQLDFIDDNGLSLVVLDVLSGGFTGEAYTIDKTSPTVEALIFEDATHVIVDFDEDVDGTQAIINDVRYGITGPGALTIGTIDQTSLPADQVRLQVTNLNTVPNTQTVEVTVGVQVTDLAGNAMGSPNMSSFDMDLTQPSLDEIRYVDENNILVVFSEEMLAGPATTIGNYTLDGASFGNFTITNAQQGVLNKNEITLTSTQAIKGSLNPGELFTLTVTNASSTITDPFLNGLSNFTAVVNNDETEPDLVSLEFVDATHLLVSFNEPIAGDPANDALYALDIDTNPVNGVFDNGTVTVISATLEPNNQDVTLEVQDMSMGLLANLDEVRVTFSPVSSITDLFNNQLNNNTAIFTFDTDPPVVTGLEPESATQLRVTFNERIDGVAAAVGTNFAIIGTTSGAKTFTSVLDANETDVIMTISSGTLASNFTAPESIIVTVNQSNIEDLAGNKLGSPNTASLMFDQTDPQVTALEFISDTQLLVRFDEPMKNLGDDSQFTVADLNGATATITVATSVASGDAMSATLTVNDLSIEANLATGDQLQVTVAGGVTDLYDRALSLSVTTAILIYDGTDLDVSTLTFVNDTQLRVTFNDDITGTDITTFGEYLLEIDDDDDGSFGDDGTLTVSAAVFDPGGQSVTLTVESLIASTLTDADEIRITVDGDMNADITDDFGNALNTNQAILTDYDAVQPNVTTLTIVDGTTVTVTFDESVDQPLAETLTNYVFDNSISTPTSASYDNSNPFVVTLGVDLSSLPNGATLMVTVSNVTDLFDNPLNTNTASSAVFTDNVDPFLTALTYVTDTQIRAQFSEAMNNTTEITTAGNYTLIDDSALPDPAISSIIHTDGFDFILINLATPDFSTAPHIGGELITLSISTATNIQDDSPQLNEVDNTPTVSFTLDRTDPQVTGITYVSNTELLVQFDEPMQNLGDDTKFGITDLDGTPAAITVSAATPAIDNLSTTLTVNDLTVATDLEDGDDLQLTVTVDGTIIDLAGRNLSVNTAIIENDETPPDADAISYIDDTHILLGFSEDIFGLGVTDISKYSIAINNDDVGVFDDGAINVISAVLEASGNEVTLEVASLSAALNDTDDIRVTVTQDATITDDFGLQLNDNIEDLLNFDETGPTVTSLEYVNFTTVIVHFNESLLDQGPGVGSQDPTNYTLQGDVSGSITVSTAVLSGSDVTLTTEDLMTKLNDGEIVTVLVNQTNVVNGFGVTAGNPNSASFTFDEVLPIVNSLVYVDNNNVLVTFNEDLDVTEATNNDTRFVLSHAPTAGGNFTITGLAVQNGNEVVITVTENINGITNNNIVTVAVTTAVTDLAGNGTDQTAGNNTKNFIMDTNQPNVTAFSYVDDTHVLVDFDEDVDVTSATNIANYNIESSGITVTAAVLEANGDDITLTTGASIKGTFADMQVIDVVVSNVTDLLNNQLNINTQSFTLDSSPPEVGSNLTFVDINTVTFDYSEPVVVAGAEDEFNYEFSGSAGLALNPTNASLSGNTLTLTIDLSGVVDGEDVNVTVSNVVDFLDNVVDPGNNEASLTFDAADPIIESARVVPGMSDQVVVDFDDDITVNDVTLYTITSAGELLIISGLASGGDGTSDLATFQINEAGANPEIDAEEIVLLSYASAAGGSPTNTVDDFSNELATIANVPVTNDLFGPPTVLATNCLIDGINLTWTKPPGTFSTTWDGVLVIARDGAAVTTTMGDLQTFNVSSIVADSDFSTALDVNVGAAGNKFVGNIIADADGDLDLMGFTGGNTYHFALFTYKENSPGSNEISTDLTGNDQPTIVTNYTALPSNGQVTLNWTAPPLTGCIDNMIIIARDNAAPTVSETDLEGATNQSSDYVALTDWSIRDNTNDIFDITGLGVDGLQFVVFNGSVGTQTTTITGLDNGTAYHFRTFLFDDGAGVVDDISAKLDVNATPIGAPNPPTSLTVACETGNEINLTWTRPTGTFGTAWEGVIVYGFAAADVSAANIDQTFVGEDAPTNDGSGIFGSGEAADAGASVVAIVNGDVDGDVTISNIDTSLDYKFVAYAYRNPGGVGDDLFSVVEGPVTSMPAGITAFTALGGNGTVDLSWTLPTDNASCISNILIVGREDMIGGADIVPAAIDQSGLNAQGFTYTANTNWGAFANDMFEITGSGLGDDNRNYVLFFGAAGSTSATITGVTNGQTYHFSVFTVGANSVSQRVDAIANPEGPTSTLNATATPYSIIASTETVTPGIDVFEFTIEDDNLSGGDNVITEIDQIVINESVIGTPVPNWTTAIADAILTDGTNSMNATSIGGSSITFSAIDNSLNALGYIDDNAAKTYTLSLWFNTGISNGAEEGNSLGFTVAPGDVTFAAGSSEFVGAIPVTSANDVVINTFNGTSSLITPSDQGFDIQVSLYEDNVTVHYMVSDAIISPAPSRVEILSGAGGVQFGNFLFNSGVGASQNETVIGLNDTQLYYTYLYAEDGDNNESVVQETNFIATIADVVDPTFVTTFPSISNPQGTSFQIDAQLNEVGQMNYVVLRNADVVSTPALAPSDQQIVNGTDGLGGVPISSGVLAIDFPNTTFSDVVAFLDQLTQYDVYYFALDDTGNPMTVSGAITTFTPLAAATTVIGSSGVALTAPNLDICVGAGYFALGDIVIDESANNDFGIANGQNLILTLSANYEFQPGVGSVSTNSPSNVNNIGISVFTDRIELNYDVSATSRDDFIRISGLMVNSDMATTGSLQRLATVSLGGNADINGDQDGSGRDHATFTSFDSPADPTPLSLEFCEGETMDLRIGELTTAGFLNSGTYEWYDEADLDAIDNRFTGTVTSFSQLGLDPDNDGTNNVTVNSSTAITFSFYVIDRNAQGCITNSATVDIIIEPVPTASAGTDLIGANAICREDQIFIGGTPAAFGGSGVFTYAWTAVEQPATVPTFTLTIQEYDDIGGVNQDIASSINANFLLTPSFDIAQVNRDTTHYYELNVLDANGCSAAPDILEVEVLGLEDIVFNISSTTFTIENTNAQVLDATPSGAGYTGLFTGSGLTNPNTSTNPGTVDFTPSSVSVGPHAITYAMTNNTTGCDNSEDINLFVTAGVEVLNGLESKYCNEAQIDNNIVVTTSDIQSLLDNDMPPLFGAWIPTLVGNGVTNTGEQITLTYDISPASFFINLAFTQSLDATGGIGANFNIRELGTDNSLITDLGSPSNAQTNLINPNLVQLLLPFTAVDDGNILSVTLSSNLQNTLGQPIFSDDLVLNVLMNRSGTFSFDIDLYQFDPNNAFVTQGGTTSPETITVTRRLVRTLIPAITLDFGDFTSVVSSLPVITINGLNEFYCETDGSVDLDAAGGDPDGAYINIANAGFDFDIASDDVSGAPNFLEYDLYKETAPGSGTFALQTHVNNSIVDFTTISGTYGTGTFQILYTSVVGDDPDFVLIEIPQGCTNTGTFEFTIYPEPTTPVVQESQNYTLADGTIVFEFCDGDLSVANNFNILTPDVNTKYNWYADGANIVQPGFTNLDGSLQTSSGNSQTVTALELFGGTPFASNDDVYRFSVTKIEQRQKSTGNLSVAAIKWTVGTTVQINFAAPINLVQFSPGNTLSVSGANNAIHNGDFIITLIDDANDYVQITNALVTSSATDQVSTGPTASITVVDPTIALSNPQIGFLGCEGPSLEIAIIVYEDPLSSTVTNVGRFDDSRTVFDNSANNPNPLIDQEFIFEFCEDEFSVFGGDNSRKVAEFGNVKLETPLLPYTSLNLNFIPGEIVDGAISGGSARIATGGVNLLQLVTDPTFNNYTVTSIQWQTGNTIRYNLMGSPNLTGLVNISDNLTVQQSINSVNDGDFPITNFGLGFIEVDNFNRNDATANEAAAAFAEISTGTFQSGETISGRTSSATGRLELDYRWFPNLNNAILHIADPNNGAANPMNAPPLHFGATADATDLGLDVSGANFASNSVVAPYEYYVVRNDYEDDHLTDNAPRNAYDGCFSLTSLIKVVIHPEPVALESDPDQDNFFQKEFFLCENDVLANIVTPNINETFYSWYPDDGSGGVGLPGAPNYLVPLTVGALNGREITQAELEFGGAGQLVPSVAGKYYFWITQTSDSDGLTTEVGSGFAGCESDPTLITITVSPFEGVPTMAGFRTSPLDVDAISFVAGNTIQYTMNGSPDLSVMVPSQYLVISGSGNTLNDGTFEITAVDDAADFIEVTNLARADNSGDETSDSPAVGNSSIGTITNPATPPPGVSVPYNVNERLSYCVADITPDYVFTASSVNSGTNGLRFNWYESDKAGNIGTQLNVTSSTDGSTALASELQVNGLAPIGSNDFITRYRLVTQATDFTVANTSTLTVMVTGGTFTDTEVITGANGTAIIESQSGNVFTLNTVTGPFISGETVTGTTGGDMLTVLNYSPATSFTGCESAGTLFEIIIYDIPQPPTETVADLRDIYYCFDEGVLSITVTGEGNSAATQQFYWYNSQADALVGPTMALATADAEGATITPAELLTDEVGLSADLTGTTLIPGDYTFFVTQAQDIESSASPSFAGCQSPAQELTIHILPDPVLPNLSISNMSSNQDNALNLCGRDNRPTIVVNNPASFDGSTEIRYYTVMGADPFSVTNQFATTTGNSPDFTLTTAEIPDDGSGNLQPGTYTFYVHQVSDIGIGMAADNSSFPGCASAEASVTFEVFPVPGTPVTTAPFVTNTQYEICQDDALVNLEIATPVAGETYRWYDLAGRTTLLATGSAPPLVTGSSVTPIGVDNSAPGTTEFFVTITEDGCEGYENIVQVDYVVNPTPTVNFNVLPAALCTDNGTINLLGSLMPAQGTGLFTIDTPGGIGLVDDLDGDPNTVIFDPLAAVGQTDPQNYLDQSLTVTITYSFTDNSLTNCVNSTQQVVTINGLPSVGITLVRPGLGAGFNEYCIDEPLLPINGSPLEIPGTTGAFTSPDSNLPITDNGDGTASINLTLAFNNGVGDTRQRNFDLDYIFSDVNGCVNTTRQAIIINNLPEPEFEIRIGGGVAPNPGAGRDADFCVDEVGVITLVDNTPGTMGTLSVGDFSATGSGFNLTSASLAFSKNGEGDYDFLPDAAVAAAIGQNSLLANTSVAFIDFIIDYTFQNTLTCQNDASVDGNTKIIRVFKIPEPNIALNTAGSGIDANEYCRDFGDLLLDVNSIDFNDALFTGTGIFREKNTGVDLETAGVIDNTIAVGGSFFDQATFNMEAAYQFALANTSFLKNLGVKPPNTRQAEFVIVYDYNNSLGCGEDPNFSEELVIRINPNPDFDFEFGGGSLTAFCVVDGIISLDAAIGETADLTPVIGFTDYSVPSIAGADGITDGNDGTATLDLQILFDQAVAETALMPMDPLLDIDIRLTLQDGNSCQTFIDKTLRIYNRPFPVFDVTRGLLGTTLPIQAPAPDPNFDAATDHEVCVDDVSTSALGDLNTEVIVLQIPGGLIGGESAVYTEATYTLGSTAFKVNADGTAYFYPAEAVIQATNQVPGLAVSEFVDFEFDLSITNAVGCTGLASQDGETHRLRVYRLPEPTLVVDYDPNSNNHYCIDDATPINVTLNGVNFDIDETGPMDFPGTGVYSITPITALGLIQTNNINAVFDPQAAFNDAVTAGASQFDPIDFTIIYSYTTVEGCQNNSTDLIFTVNPLPIVTIDANTTPSFSTNEYCIDANNGIVDLDAAAFFGTDVLTGRTAVGSGTFFSDFLGDDSPGISPGILTTGPGRAQFDLATAFDLGSKERGTHIITYEFQDNEGCINSASTTIVINKKPVVSFSGIGGCNSEPVTFLATVDDIATGDAITAYEWDFDWNGVQSEFLPDTIVDTSNPLFGPIVNQTYSTFGEFRIGLRVQSNKSCSSEISEATAVIGEIPSTNFTYQGLSVDELFFFSATPEDVAFGSIDTIRVNFDDGSSLERFRLSAAPADALSDDDFMFDHQFLAAGVFQVEFTFITNNNCTRSHSRLVPVLPKVAVNSTTPYEQSFENSVIIARIINGSPENLWIDGWVPDVRGIDDKTSNLFEAKKDSVNTWDWGNPSGVVISQAATGTNAIVTNITGSFLPEERSWIYTPAFDLSALKKPLVKFDRIVNFGSTRDGVVLEYSTDGGTVWTILGDFDQDGNQQTGLNWYDRESIQGDPGQSNDRQIAWGQANQPSWAEARHKLDVIPEAERTNVIFRFFLGAASTEAGDGFGIDNFVIEERSRFVLLEQFSGLVDGSIGLANDALINILDDPAINNDDGVLITYQTDLNNGADLDPINLKNPADPNSRVFFYGVEQVPTSVLNGVTAVSGGFSSDNALPWDANDFNKEALTDNDLDLQLIINSSADDVISVTAEIRTDNAISFGDDIRLYIAVVEKSVESGGVPLRNVLRRFLPDGSGSTITKNGSTIESINHSWRINFVDDSDNLAVVAFVQDNRDKRILQAATIDVGNKQDIIVTGIDDLEFNEEMINLYPNPADWEMNVAFDTEIDQNFQWTVINQVGAQLIFGDAFIGDKGFVIDTSRLPSGMYFLLMGNEDKQFNHFKFIVTH